LYQLFVVYDSQNALSVQAERTYTVGYVIATRRIRLLPPTFEHFVQGPEDQNIRIEKNVSSNGEYRSRWSL